jgi:PiT family inorganic phosphate transporter
MTLILTVVFVALLFEYINGFHDTANSIATSISTKVLTPRQAIILSTIFNLLGALAGTAVAKTIGQGLVDTRHIEAFTILSALFGAIGWNLLTWYFGLPSSSSHALVGGLCGAALAASGNNWNVIFVRDGLWPKVLKPMVIAPLCGLAGGFVVMVLLYVLLKKAKPNRVNRAFGGLQWLSAAWMSYSHGTNDAQKTMGIIALTLFLATTQTTSLELLPGWLGFLRTPQFEIHIWIKVVCALTMAAGTAAGGWRIIKTLGTRLVKLQPVHGFAAQVTAAAIIETASHWGVPLSTTHVISSAIMGVGSAKRFNAVKWTVVERMLWAWVLTIPLSGLLAYGIEYALRWIRPSH